MMNTFKLMLIKKTEMECIVVMKMIKILQIKVIRKLKRNKIGKRKIKNKLENKREIKKRKPWVFFIMKKINLKLNKLN